jgi:hypothetical protein
MWRISRNPLEDRFCRGQVASARFLHFVWVRLDVFERSSLTDYSRWRDRLRDASFRDRLRKNFALGRKPVLFGLAMTPAPGIPEMVCSLADSILQ